MFVFNPQEAKTSGHSSPHLPRLPLSRTRASLSLGLLIFKNPSEGLYTVRTVTDSPVPPHSGTRYRPVYTETGPRGDQPQCPKAAAPVCELTNTHRSSLQTKVGRRRGRETFSPENHQPPLKTHDRSHLKKHGPHLHFHKREFRRPWPCCSGSLLGTGTCREKARDFHR